MGGLYKKEVVIRSGSTISKDAAFDWVGGWLDSFYQAANGEDDFFAGLFDTRDNQAYLIFHSACKAKFELNSLVIKTSAEAVGAALSTDAAAEGLTDAAVKAMEQAIQSKGFEALDDITSALNYAKAQIAELSDDTKTGMTALGSDLKHKLTAEQGLVIEALSAEFESLSNELTTVVGGHRTELATLWEEIKNTGTDATLALNQLMETFQAQFGQDSAAHQAMLNKVQTLSDVASESLDAIKEQIELAIEKNQQAAQYISILAESEEQSLKLLGELEDKVNTATNRIENAASQADDLISQLEEQSQSSMDGAGGESLTESRVMELIAENSTESGGDSGMGSVSGESVSLLEVKDLIREAINQLKDSLTVSSNGAVEIEVDPASTEDFA